MCWKDSEKVEATEFRCWASVAPWNQNPVPSPVHNNAIFLLHAFLLEACLAPYWEVQTQKCLANVWVFLRRAANLPNTGVCSPWWTLQTPPNEGTLQWDSQRTGGRGLVTTYSTLKFDHLAVVCGVLFFNLKVHWFYGPSSGLLPLKESNSSRH